MRPTTRPTMRPIIKRIGNCPSAPKRLPVKSAEDPDGPSTSKNLQETIEEEKPPASFLNSLKKTTTDLVGATGIHGFQYLRQGRINKEKYFWIGLLLIAMLVCAYLLLEEYWRWDKTPVILSFAEREHEVSEIPFPAITICTETKYVTTDTINFTRFYNYLYENYHQKPLFVEPPSWLNDDEYLKMRALLQVCGNYLVKDMNFKQYPELNVVHHLNAIVPEFNVSFLHCKFNDTSGECNSLFEKVYTDEGICYTFNGFNSTELYRENTHQYQYFQIDEHIRNRKKHVRWNILDGFYDKEDYNTYPERVLGSGFDSALLVILRGLRKNLDYVCRGPVQGFKVMLHAPDTVPQVDKRFYLVPYEKDVLILVKPAFIYTTKNVRDISPKRRKCYYPDERYLKFFKFYNQNNCEIECMANFTLRECGCVIFSMPRLADTKVCDAEHIKCYDQADNDFLRSEYTNLGKAEEKCNCMPDCWMVDYHVEISHGTFNMKRILQGADREDAEASRVTIYFSDNEFRAWKRSEFITLTDFIGQCGGLFGVLMGGTLLIILEIFYYLIIRLCWHYTNAD